MDIRESVYKVFNKLTFAPFLGGKDMNLDNPSWEEADLRLCITNNGTFFAKLASANVTQLASIVRNWGIQAGKKVYIDYTYQVDKADVQALRGQHVPEVFGWASYRTLDEFDVCFSSFSIHYEIPLYYGFLKGAGLEPFYLDREEAGVAGRNQPLLVGGGVVAQLLEPLHGHARGSMLDLVYLGEGEVRIGEMLSTLTEDKNWKETLQKDREVTLKKLVTTYDNLYWPNGYEHVYEGAKLLEVKTTRSWVPERVIFYRCWDRQSIPMFERSLQLKSNDGASRGELQISKGCGGRASCSFCEEGTAAGPWREYDTDAIIRNMDLLKKSMAPNVFCAYSYNSNYHSKLLDIYKKVAEQYSYLTVIALRADVLSEQPEYLRMQKALGIIRVTVALEGCSDRVRNKILNKCLSWEQFLRLVENVFKQRLVNMKVNLIATGYETEADNDEFISYMQKVDDLRKKWGARTQIKFSATNLVHYWNTPMQWWPRLSAINEMHMHRVFRKSVNFCKTIGISFRFNSGPGFILQQVLNDMGRLCTTPMLPILERYWMDAEEATGGEPSRLLVDATAKGAGLDTPELLEEYFKQEWALGQPTPATTFEIMPPKVEKDAYDNFGKEERRMCLRTPANRTPKCTACGLCPPTEIGRSTKRECDSNVTVEEVEEVLFKNKPRSALTVRYRVSPSLEARNHFKVVGNHHTASRILRASELLNKEFYACGNYSDYATSMNEAKDSWGGYGCFDVFFRLDKEELQKELEKVTLDSINRQIETVQVIGLDAGEYNARKMIGESQYLWRFSTALPATDLAERYTGFAGKMKILVKGMGGAMIEEVDFPTDKFTLLMKQTSAETVGYFTLPFRYNPYLALWSFYGGRSREFYNTFQLDKVEMVQILGSPCSIKGCHNITGISMSKGKPMKYCAACLAKAMITKE